MELPVTDAPSSRRRQAGRELLAVGATWLAFFAANRAGVQGPFLVAAGVGWGGYLAWQIRTDADALTVYGLRRRGAARGFRVATGVILVGVIALALVRLVRGWQPLPPSSLGIFCIYPLWAFAQQLFLQGFVVMNLERLGVPRLSVVALAALLFGLAHSPDWPLVLLCMAAGFVFIPMFLVTRTLYAVSLTHAWLGTLAYYWLLDRDPWRDMIPV